MDHYSLLGLTPLKHANEADIKKAYKRAALKYHPDRGGDAEVFKALKVAYDDFMDPRKKRQYDMKMRKVITLKKGKTLERDLPLTLEQLYKGATLKFNIDRVRIKASPTFTMCGQSKIMLCRNCDGNGYVEIQRRFANFVNCSRGPCNACKSTGVTLAPGATMFKQKTTVQITVKPGATKGTRMVVSNESDEHLGTVPGDICFVIKEKPHPIFRQRKGSTLYATLNITLKQALTSAEVEIPHVSGQNFTVKLPGVVTEKTTLWLEGKGMPDQSKGGAAGKLGLKFTIAFPNRLTEEQQEAIRRIL